MTATPEQQAPAAIPETARNYAGGDWVDASGETHGIVNPATGNEFATVPYSTDTEVDVVVETAREAFQEGAKRRPSNALSISST